jgi:hypothetical protein
MKEIISKDKNIGIIAIIFTFYALFHHVFQIVFSAALFTTEDSHLFIKIFILYFNFFEFSFFGGINFLNFQFSNSSIQVCYLNYLFYALMITGSLFYIMSNYKETKLLLFVFSLIFFKLFIGIIFSLNFFINISTYTLGQVFLHLVTLLFKVLIVIITYGILKELITKKELNIIQENESQYWIPASKYNRIIHLVIDLFFCFLIFYPIAYSIINIEYFKAIIINLSDNQQKLILYFLVIIFRFIYYFTFESIFGITPAKILTNTVVASNDGIKAKTKNIFKRTITRFVPFESISFITYGWHDTWSETNVFQLKPNKFSGLFYFLLFLIIAICVYYIMYYIENNAYTNLENYQKLIFSPFA